MDERYIFGVIDDVFCVVIYLLIFANIYFNFKFASKQKHSIKIILSMKIK